MKDATDPVQPEAQPELTHVLQSDLSKGAAGEVLPELLRAARLHLGMEIGFISQFKDGHRIFRYVDEENGSEVLQVGGSDPLEELTASGWWMGVFPN